MPRLAGWEIGRVPGFYKGAGVPSNTTLEAGDYIIGDEYWDTTNKNFYVCDTGGSATTSVWTKVSATAVAGTSIITWAQIAVHDTAGAAETSFTWSGLNGDTDVTYVIIGRWFSPAPAADDILVVQPNADATAANYNSEHLTGNNATASASRSAGTLAGLFLAEALDNNDVGAFTATIFAKTGLNRVMTATGGDAMSTNFTVESQTGAWLNTATNITSLKITTLLAATDIGIGSHFELWAPRTVHVVSVP